TAEVTYSVRESENEGFGPGLVFGSDMGPLAGTKPEHLWAGVIRSNTLTFEVLEDDSEELRIRRASDSGKGIREHLQLELTPSKSKVNAGGTVDLSLAASNTGPETLYLGNYHGLHERGPRGDRQHLPGPRGTEALGLAPGTTAGMGMSRFGSGEPLVPGKYEVWLEYLSYKGPREVLAKCENPSKGRQWWRPNGAVMEEPPYESLASYPSRRREKSMPEMRWYEFLFRIAGASSERTNYRWEIGPSSIPVFAVPMCSRRYEHIGKICKVAGAIEEGAEVGHARVGVAAGQWETQSVYDSNGGATDEAAGLRDISFAGPDKEEEGFRISLSGPLAGDQCRVVAIDSDGNEHEAVRATVGHERDSIQNYVGLFEELALEKVREFQLQTRSCEWVEFRNVSLIPGAKTAVEVEFAGMTASVAPAEVEPGDIQVRGEEILRRMAEVNRYWLVGPPARVKNYAYDLIYGGPEPERIQIANPSEAAWHFRQGIRYGSILPALVSNPGNAIIKAIDKTADRIRLDFAFREPLEIDLGHGVRRMLVLCQAMESFKEGSLWLDSRKMVPTKISSGGFREYFLEYTSMGEGHYVPLLIKLGWGSDDFLHWGFRLHEPGLWLFDQSSFVQGSASREAACTQNVRINDESISENQLLPRWEFGPLRAILERSETGLHEGRKSFSMTTRTRDGVLVRAAAEPKRLTFDVTGKVRPEPDLVSRVKVPLASVSVPRDSGIWAEKAKEQTEAVRQLLAASGEFVNPIGFHIYDKGLEARVGVEFIFDGPKDPVRRIKLTVELRDEGGDKPTTFTREYSDLRIAAEEYNAANPDSRYRMSGLESDTFGFSAYTLERLAQVTVTFEELLPGGSASKATTGEGVEAAPPNPAGDVEPPVEVNSTAWGRVANGLLARLADPQVNAEGQRILRQVAEVNRYWLIGPPPTIEHYSYDSKAVNSWGEEGRDERTSGSNAEGGRTRYGQRPGYSNSHYPVLGRLAAYPSAAIVTRIEKDSQTIRLHFIYDDLSEPRDKGNVDHDELAAVSKAGSLLLDSEKMVPLMLKTSTREVTFRDYASLGDGRYVPLRISTGAGSDYMYELYGPGLWLSAGGVVGRGRDGWVGSTSNVMINGRRAEKSDAALIRVAEIPEAEKAKGPMRNAGERFINLVLGKESMTLDGRPTRWETIWEHLAEVRGPSQVGLHLVVPEGIEAERLREAKTLVSFL
ncbi:MAG: hypothetical protein ACYTEQ_26425, partial [Planctomycetota bacterium]